MVLQGKAKILSSLSLFLWRHKFFFLFAAGLMYFVRIVGRETTWTWTFEKVFIVAGLVATYVLARREWIRGLRETAQEYDQKRFGDKT